MDTEYKLDVEVSSMCRCCLTVDEENLRNLFCTDVLDGSIVALPKVYENVTDIRVKKDDKLPDGICAPCKTKIKDFYSFKQKCINANALLCKILDVPLDQTTVNPVTEHVNKPSVEEKATQCITNEITTQGTQTNLIGEDQRDETKGDEIAATTSSESKPIMNIVRSITLFKREKADEQDVIEAEGQVSLEECALDYDCSGYISPEMYVLEDAGSVEGSEDPFLEQDQYKVEIDDDMEIDQLEILEVPEFNDVVMQPKEVSSKRSKKTETCNICKIDIKSTMIKTHRNTHQQTLPMILNSIPYFRCGRCKTVFAEVGHLENHFLNDSCYCYDDERSCTDYQYLEEFPECDAEEEGPFSGCRTLRLCSVVPRTDHSFTCELCNNFSCVFIQDMLDHCVNEHFENDDENNGVYYDELMSGIHRCGVCQLNQSSLSAALRHVFFHLTSFPCPIKDCNDEFAEFKLLSLHLEQSHLAKENVKSQRCMHCGEISQNYQSFRQHQRKECPKKVYRCEVCAKKFFYKSSLSMHMKYHSDARFACEVCNKSFSQLCDYKVHFRIHSGEKPYKCEFCDKTFRSISNRKDHMSTHRTDKTFMCEICNQSFKSERTLRGHYPIHNATKKFQCTHCEKSFHRRFHLTLHIKSHEKKEFIVSEPIQIESESRVNWAV